jgi:sulfur relay protein TusB/DsrH
MTKTAFLVMKSPQELDPTHLIARFADRNEASVILVEDGVFQAVLPQPAERLKRTARDVLVTKDDLEARGFQASDLKVGQAVLYEDVVDCIMDRTERTITL